MVGGHLPSAVVIGGHLSNLAVAAVVGGHLQDACSMNLEDICPPKRTTSANLAAVVLQMSLGPPPRFGGHLTQYLTNGGTNDLNLFSPPHLKF